MYTLHFCHSVSWLGAITRLRRHRNPALSSAEREAMSLSLTQVTIVFVAYCIVAVLDLLSSPVDNRVFLDVAVVGSGCVLLLVLVLVCPIHWPTVVNTRCVCGLRVSQCAGRVAHYGSHPFRRQLHRMGHCVPGMDGCRCAACHTGPMSLLLLLLLTELELCAFTAGCSPGVTTCPRSGAEAQAIRTSTGTVGREVRNASSARKPVLRVTLRECWCPCFAPGCAA